MDSQLNDFSLDMISSDMDFETVYNIYNGLQQQIAKSEVEELKKVQQLNQVFQSPFASSSSPSSNNFTSEGYEAYSGASLSPKSNEGSGLSMEGGLANANSGEPSSLGAAEDTLSNTVLGTFVPTPNYTFTDNFTDSSHSISYKTLLEQHRLQIIQGLKPLNNYFVTKKNEIKSGRTTTHSDYASLLSATESNALEQFLDSIGQDDDFNDLDFRSNSLLRKSELQRSKLIDEAFSYKTDFKFTSIQSNQNVRDDKFQMPSPMSSLDGSSVNNMGDISKSGKKRSVVDDGLSSQSSSPPDSKLKRKRITRKPLLTNEQKKINHSTSEQKRRQLIKVAFDRVTSLVCTSQERGKNISKYIALQKVSAQIKSLNDMNEKLKKLNSSTESIK